VAADALASNFAKVPPLRELARKTRAQEKAGSLRSG